jgi:RNA polymerase sigma-70 factor (ECF subfamily)
MEALFLDGSHELWNGRMISGTDGTPEERLQALFDRYYEALVRFVMGKYHQLSREDARDIAQAVFVSVYKHMEEPIRTPWPFLTVAATRLAINLVTRDHLGDGLDLDDIAPPQHPGASPETRLLEKERAGRLAAAIETLPRATRTCLHLRLEGYKYREIADLLDVTVDAVKSRLHYAMAQLRQALGADADSLGVNGDDHEK